jgi:phosphopantetheinyl transferase
VAAIHQLADLSPKRHAFLACWTRKEALIKAFGLGLSCPLNSVEVSVSPSEPARVLSIAGSAEAAAEWQLEDLSRFPSCAAAVAFRSRTARLRVHESEGCASVHLFSDQAEIDRD